MSRRRFGSFITLNPTDPTSSNSNGIWPPLEVGMNIGKSRWTLFAPPQITYHVIGGGGGGGSGATGGLSGSAGGGGGSGGYQTGTYSITKGTTYSFTVGSGGSGNTSPACGCDGNGSNGGAGGSTTGFGVTSTGGGGEIGRAHV